MASARRPRGVRAEVAGTPASVVFIRVVDLSAASSDVQALAALSTLSAVLRRCTTRGTSTRILAAISGAIVLRFRGDEAAALAWEVATACEAAKLAVRIGVTRGEVFKLNDADGLPNYVGSAINDAARLAYSKSNPGISVKTDALQGRPEAHAWLRPTAHAHAGKRTEQLVAYDSTEPLRTVSDVPARRTAPRSRPAILLSYDLERFSVNASHHLARRFKVVADHIRERSGVKPSEFSPGGDGGVLVLPAGTKRLERQGRLLAEELNFLLSEVSFEFPQDLQVTPRSALHYGSVVTYRNAEGVVRPTGRAVFEADRLPYKAGEIVLSRAFLDHARAGRTTLGYQGYREILPEEHPDVLGKFVRRHDEGRMLTAEEFQKTTAHFARKFDFLKHVSLNAIHSGSDTSRQQFNQIIADRAGKTLAYSYVTNVLGADPLKHERITLLLQRLATADRSIRVAHLGTRSPRLFNFMVFGSRTPEVTLLVFSDATNLGAILFDDSSFPRMFDEAFERLYESTTVQRLTSPADLQRLQASSSEDRAGA